MGFLYVIRSRGLTKIGITGNLRRRMNELKPDRVCQVVKCSRDGEKALEKKLHQRFARKRLPGSEYFFLSCAERQRACRLARRAGERVQFPYQPPHQAKTYWLRWWVSQGRLVLMGTLAFGIAVGMAAVVIVQRKPQGPPPPPPISVSVSTKLFPQKVVSV